MAESAQLREEFKEKKDVAKAHRQNAEERIAAMEEMKADGEDLVTDNRNNEGLDDDFW